VAAHRPSLGTHCGCFLDSSVLLHAVFEEPEFSAKISLFEKSAIKHNLPIEVLPKVNHEVTRRMMIGSQEFVYILRDIVSEIESSAGKIGTITADSKALTLIESAVDQLIVSLRGKFSQDVRRYETAKEKVRVVETTAVSRLYDELDTANPPTLAELLRKVEDELGESYVKYCDKLTALNRRLRPAYIPKDSFPTVNPQVRANLSLHLKNSDDIDLLCEATGRMFQLNRRCVLVSLDYTDLVRNKVQIEKETLLRVCDPLYYLAHLEDVMASAISPIAEIKRRGQAYSEIINSPTPAAIV
jgi:hypothetical protein